MRGVLRSTSLMIGAAARDDAIARARAHPTLDVGVHLTLVEERPVLAPADVPTLVHDGRFWPSHGAVGLRYLQGRWSVVEAGREIAAQLDAVAAAGIVPSHLDGHQHLHLLPGVFGRVASEARRREIRFVRTTLADPVRLGGGLRAATMLGVQGAAWLAVRRAATGDLARLVPFVTVGFVDAGGRLDTPGLLALLDHAHRRRPDGIVEVMLHPGRDDGDTRRIDTDSGYRRERDLALLCDPDLPARLAERGIEITSFRELAAALPG